MVKKIEALVAGILFGAAVYFSNVRGDDALQTARNAGLQQPSVVDASYAFNTCYLDNFPWKGSKYHVNGTRVHGDKEVRDTLTVCCPYAPYIDCKVIR